jgi:hypothetical protein
VDCAWTELSASKDKPATENFNAENFIFMPDEIEFDEYGGLK